MFAFAPDPNQPKAELYADLVGAAKALIHGESDSVANMANIAALIWQFLPRLNWSGFYRTVGADELVLGPFIGKPACIRIPFGQGVCGTAAASAATQLVPDVHAFPGPYRLRCGQRIGTGRAGQARRPGHRGDRPG